MNRSLAIDNLRAIAVLVVVAGHFWGYGALGFAAPVWLMNAMVNTPYGVDLFFAISGYLLGGQLLDVEPSTGLLGRFYLRRLARTLPLYLVIVVLCWPLSASGERLAMLTFTQNFYWLSHGMGTSIAAPTWSLAVEEQFYLVLPALIFLVPRERLPWVLVGLALLSAWLRSVSGDIAIYTMMPCRMDALVLGVALAWRERTCPFAPVRMPRSVVLAWVGRRSYAIYLLHVPCAMAVMSVFGSSGWSALVAFCVVLSVSDFAYRYLERPVHELARARLPLRASSRPVMALA